jgi:hypothetical protein
MAVITSLSLKKAAMLVGRGATTDTLVLDAMVVNQHLRVKLFC